MYIFQLILPDGRRAAIIEHSRNGAKNKAWLFDPKGGWKHAEILCKLS